MNLCKVLGSVTSTLKHPAFEGRKLMVVQPLDERQQPLGKSFIAVDHTSSAGPGDVVLVMREGGGVRQLLGRQDAAHPLADRRRGGRGGRVSEGFVPLPKLRADLVDTSHRLHAERLGGQPRRQRVGAAQG